MRRCLSFFIALICLFGMIFDIQAAAADAKYTLRFDIKFEENLFFSTYDVALYVDKVKIGEYEHGVDFKAEATVTAGSHTIRFCSTEKSSYDGSFDVNVNSDLKIGCEIHCHSGYISIYDTVITPIGTDTSEDVKLTDTDSKDHESAGS